MRVSEDEAPSRPSRPAPAWRIVALVALALLGAGVLAALIVSQSEANRQRDRALALQTHSYQVMILARTLSGTIARSEASLGRYVISGDRQLGQLYYAQWQQAGEQLDLLDRLTDDNGEQQPRIDALRRAYQARGEELSLTALSTAYKRNDQALARYYQARKAASLQTIDATLDRITDRERALLEERTAVAMAAVVHAGAKARLLTAFGVLLALGAMGLGWLTLRAQEERAVARGEAREQRARAVALEAAVTAATDELRAQEAKLRQAQKMDAVGQLTGGIAHDFNNMLAVVLGGLELARRHASGDARTLRYLDSAAEGANRAAALTRRLLAFSREDKLAPEAIDPAALIGGMRDLLDRTLGDLVTVEVEEANRGWTVFADRVALENAILNLAVNARDAMNGRGQLRILTAARELAEDEVDHCPTGDYVTLAVRDTGCGMTPEVIERVFEPFFTTKPVGKGTGLGLSQIFALARQLGGEVGIESAVGEGTTVTLYIPRYESPAPAAVLVEVTEPVPALAPEGLTVLVVEDDPRVLAATVGAVEELGHRAIPCDDPRAAPALLDTHPEVELVISDVLMPGQTGPEMVTDVVRRRPDIAVLFVTGFAGEAGDAAEFGERLCLRKPFTLAGLERAIGEAVAGRMPEAIAAE